MQKLFIEILYPSFSEKWEKSMGLAGSSEIITTVLPLSKFFKTLLAFKTGNGHFNPVKSCSSIKTVAP